MNELTQHLIVLVLSAGVSRFGWFMAHNPVRIYRALNLSGAQFGESAFIGFFRIMGWCFAIIFSIGVVLQGTLVAHALIRYITR